MNEEIMIHKNQTTMLDFEYEIVMSLEEFNNRCMPKMASSAEFDVRPNNIANRDDNYFEILTKNNMVYFKRIKYVSPEPLEVIIDG